MKLFNIFMIFFLLFALAGCEINSSDNGDLDGYWYLRQVDSLSNGKSVPYTSNKVFWGIYGNMTVTEDITGTKSLFRFSHKGNELRLYDAMVHDRLVGDTLLWEKDIKEHNLFFQGVNSLDETFVIESLSGERMVLKSSILRLHFDKY